MLCVHCAGKYSDPTPLHISPSYAGPRNCLAVRRSDGGAVDAGVVHASCSRGHVMYLRFVDLDPADQEAALLPPVTSQLSVAA